MTSDNPHHSQPGRRRFLTGAAALATSLFIPGLAHAAAGAGVRTIGLRNLHTGERLKTIYWADGVYVRDALYDVNVILRDFRAGDVYPIDVRLLDLLHAVQTKLGTRAPFNVISGYRSPATNAALAAKNGGVARRSLHMQGMAIDISLPDRDLPALHRAARSLRAGGVGYYPNSGFVHMDVGRVRYW